MTTALRLAKGLALPVEAVTQTFGFVGKRGSGKTFGALKMAELFLGAGAQIVVIDPVGKWWSLRLAADGKGKGFDVPVLGGHRGDLPLEPGAGALIADLVVDRRASLVLDVSLMTQGELKRFARDFGERLLQRKKGEPQPTPLHLFIEEAQELIPERAQGDDERMKAAFVRLVKLGRNWGIGVTLVTQRPQAVSKEALNQTECLVALQTVGAHERKALREWIAHHGEQEKLVDLLPALQSGEAYVWSPSWLGALERVRIAARATFDASATPTMASAKRGAAAAPLGEKDLEALRGAMAATIERAQAEDPKTLRKRVAELERELRAALAGGGAPDPQALERARIEGRQEVGAQADRQVAEIVGQLQARDDRIAHAVDDAQRVSKSHHDELARALGKVADAVREPISLMAETIARQVAARPAARNLERQIDRRASAKVGFTPGGKTETRRPAAPLRQVSGSDEGLTAPRQRILDTLAWLESIGISGPERTRLALWCDCSPTSGGYFNNLGALRSAGLIEYPSGGTVALTDAGRAAATPLAVPPTASEMQEWICRKVGAPKAAILRALIEVYPESIERDELADRVGVSRSSGGYFNNLGSLRTLGVVEYPERGHVRASAVLFLEGRA